MIIKNMPRDFNHIKRRGGSKQADFSSIMAAIQSLIQRPFFTKYLTILIFDNIKEEMVK